MLFMTVICVVVDQASVLLIPSFDLQTCKQLGIDVDFVYYSRLVLVSVVHTAVVG